LDAALIQVVPTKINFFAGLGEDRFTAGGRASRLGFGADAEVLF
jgi:hypothetical protein